MFEEGPSSRCRSGRRSGGFAAAHLGDPPVAPGEIARRIDRKNLFDAP